MIEFKLDVTRAVDRMLNMRDDIEGFYGDIYVEFVDWQEQDMKRQYPALVPAPPDAVYTMIYPRSRDPKWKRRGRRLRKAARRIVRPKAGPKSSRLTILRPELFDKLRDRMGQLLIDKLKWR